MKDFKLYLIIGSLLLIGYVVAEYHRPKPINWQSTLYYNDKIPYGTYVLHNQLRHLFPGARVVNTNLSPTQVFKDTASTAGSYLMVAHSINFSKTDYEAMLRYIRAGNSVLMSAFNWNGIIADTLKLRIRTTNAGPVQFNFTNPQLKAAQPYSFKSDISNQYFFEFDTARAVSLSQNQKGQTNLLRFSFGKGSLYLFPNPHLLTNYSLLTADGAAYTERVLSYLPATPTIYWDEYQNHDISIDESPFRVLFAYESLRWAYYISLAAILIFVLFEIKRRQRIIPVIEPLKNTTAEFVGVIGRVYYEQRDNRNIALKKIIYLTDYLRTRYQLKAEYRSPEFAQQLAHKTGIDTRLITDLLSHINYVQAQHLKVDDHELIELTNLIDKFYAQA